MESKTFSVPNISCEHCVHTIEREVADVPGVRKVTADLNTKVVTVDWDNPANWASIEKTLTDIDYPPAKS